MHKSEYKKFKKLYLKAIEKSLEIIGLLLVDESVSLSPVDTGRLRQSIDYLVDKSKMKVIFGTNVFYAIFLEKGTIKQKAQPFIKPALIRNYSKIENVIKKVFKGEI